MAVLAMGEREALETIWNYMVMRQPLEKADVILVLCSYDLRVAERAAEIYQAGWAPRVTISGGGRESDLSGLWKTTEADAFAAVMEKAGVPRRVMWLEDQSENSGQNAEFTSRLWAGEGFDPQIVIAVQKPYMERRAYATLKKWWPERKIIMASPQVTLAEWLEGSAIPAKRSLDAMVGDAQCILDYPAKGFQIPQDMPEDVREALRAAQALGYSRPPRVGPDTRS